jgi:hypothetical protein
MDAAEYLVKQHTFEKKSEDHFRYMLYHPRDEETWKLADYGKKGVRLRRSVCG